MSEDSPVDYYEVLQISVSAEPDTVHRVYRLLAQRFHPDNRDSGNEDRFRAITEAYRVLSDLEQRARYDVSHARQRQDRWRLVSSGAGMDTTFGIEQRVRLTVLEVLYTRRLVEPEAPGMFVLELEKLTGRPREHLQFTIWYLLQKKFVERGDNSVLTISAAGIDYLEEHHQATPQPARLRAVNQ